MSSFRSDEAMHSLCAGCEEGEFAEGCEMGEFAEADTDAWAESKIEESVAEIITAFPRVQHARITPDSDGDSSSPQWRLYARMSTLSGHHVRTPRNFICVEDALHWLRDWATEWQDEKPAPAPRSSSRVASVAASTALTSPITPVITGKGNRGGTGRGQGRKKKHKPWLHMKSASPHEASPSASQATAASQYFIDAQALIATVKDASLGFWGAW